MRPQIGTSLLWRFAPILDASQLRRIWGTGFPLLYFRVFKLEIHVFRNDPRLALKGAPAQYVNFRRE